VAEGEFHEIAGLAALWQLPLLFCYENNLYTMGTAPPRSHTRTDLALKATAYEIPSSSVDGMDVLAVRAAASQAVDTIRSAGGPHFLELRTYRLRAHSMCDPRRCRSRDEVRQWQRHDPIPALAGHLRESGLLGNDDLAGLERTVAADIDAAVAFADAGSLEPVHELTRFVYADPRRRTATGPGRREGEQR
jgi:pyruvate dehydrogenase E1 component alpha subunit